MKTLPFVNDSLPANSEEPGGSLLRPVLKGAVLLAVLIACLSIVYLTSLRQLLHQVWEINTRLQGMGLAAPFIFIGGVALLVAIGCPRLLLCPIGGLAFGFWKGFFWTQVGTLIGFYATFLFVRWGGRDFVLGRSPRLRQYAAFFKQSGFAAVVLLRQMPVAGFFINILLGLTRLKHRDFILGTLLGITPEAIPATLIGSSAVHHSFYKSAGSLSIAIVCLVALWVLIGLYFRTSESKVVQSVRRNFKRAVESQNDHQSKQEP